MKNHQSSASNPKYGKNSVDTWTTTTKWHKNFSDGKLRGKMDKLARNNLHKRRCNNVTQHHNVFEKFQENARI